MTTSPIARSHCFPLIPLAETALTESAEITGHSRTDVINRAVQMYAFLVKERAAGKDVLIRDGDQVARITWDES